MSEDDPFAVMLTSGTTGFPKGCLTTQRTFVFHCINNAIEKGLGAHDIAILSSPIYFNAGRSFTLGIIYFGGTMILHERFDAEEVLQDHRTRESNLHRRGADHVRAHAARFGSEKLRHRFAALPRDHGRQGSSERAGRFKARRLRRIFTVPTLRRIQARWRFRNQGTWTSKPNAAGRPVWCVDLRIVDEDNRPVKVGEVGEIICQSPLATHGYYKNPEATDASFRDGWFYTGDLGYFDEEGYLFVAGRKKDMVKSGGISIYPLEIESVIYSHPAILEAAVIGVPDPQWGEAVKAVVVLKPECRARRRRVASIL